MMTSRLGVNELLEQHFDTAFAAPDGIKKLRELILTLAMQGKLVEQDPNDPPASELLKAIEAEKQHLVKDGKIKQPQPLLPIKLEEVPYELPLGWEWVRLGSILSFEYGDNLPSDQRSNSGEFPVYGSNGIVGTHNKALVKSSCIVIGRKGSAGALNLCLSEGCCVTDVAYYCIPPEGIYLNFCFQLLHTLRLDSLGKGIKPGLNRNEVYELVIAIPPLPEQNRIVTKIDQLMAKCDELEKLRKEREEMRLAVHAAAIKQLLDSPLPCSRRRESSSTEGLDHRSPSAQGHACGEDEKGLAGDGIPVSGWDFLQQHFCELYTVKENVAELRKAILQLAVMGRLVPQDPNDPPASELLKVIEAEKQHLVKNGKIKQPKPLQPIKPEEVFYELPRGWEWVRLDNVISFIDAGWSPKCENEPAKENEWGVLKTTAVQPLQFLAHENKALPTKLTPRPDAQVGENDILITRAGPRNRVGICCVAKAVRPQLMLSDKIIRFKIYGDLIFPDYCALAINIGHGAEQMEKMKSGMADSQMNISQDKVKQVMVALPPLPEQHRIVAKIDQLMVLCDKLEQQIEAATGKQTELLNAVMAQV